MSSDKKPGRGRPKKYDIFNPSPRKPPKKNFSKENAGSLNWRLAGGRNADEIFRNLRKGEYQSIPMEILVAINDYHLDTMPETEREEVIRQYDEAVNKAKADGAKGAHATKSKAEQRWRQIFGKNSDLLRRIKSGNLTIHGAAQTMQDQWSKRGDGGKTPGISTISRQLKKMVKK